MRIMKTSAYNNFPGETLILSRYTTHSTETNNNMWLCDAINNLIEEIMKAQSVKIIFKSFQISEVELPEKIKLNIFSIVKEHLNNIVSQKKVFEINIGISLNKSRLLLSIADNIVRIDSTPGTHPQVIDVRSMADLHTGNLELIYNPYIGNCLIYQQRFNS